MRENLSTILAILMLSIGIFAASPGSLDYSFGNNGKIASNIGSGGNSIALLTDGKILASAFSNTAQDGPLFHIIR